MTNNAVVTSAAVLTWNPDHLRLAIEAAGVAFWCWTVDTNRLTMDPRAFDLWDVPIGPFVTFEDLSARIHPADRDRVRAAFAGTRAIVGSYEIDFRILVGDVVRWISTRGQGHDANILDRQMYGTFLDVTGRKQAEEANELLAGEMGHRVKNLLAVASALTEITSRSATTAQELTRNLTHRLTALGRAHDLVRQSGGENNRTVLLGDLLSVLLEPYDDMGAFSGRIRVSVPKIIVGEKAATTLALIVHELATNALKHGALSATAGTLDVSCTDHHDEVVIVWTERGGPPVFTPAGPSGFGSKLMARSMAGQFAGSIATEWSMQGAVVSLRMAKVRVAS